MKAAILKCKAGSRFHFGRYAPDSDTALTDSSESMHSDTLFAALVNTYNDIYDDTDAFVNFFEKGDIRISSVFFCLEQNGNYIWFLPKPVSFDLAETSDRKVLKRIRFISKGLWESLKTPEALDKESNDDLLIIQEDFALLKSELELKGKSDSFEKNFKLYNSIHLPKVQVRERKNKGNLYALNVIETGDNSKLNLEKNIDVHYYFLFEFSKNLDSNYAKRFRTVLEVLQDSGIGAERSTIGQVESIEVNENWEAPKGGGTDFCTLSLLSPAEEELPLLKFYKTMLRGGRAIGVKKDDTEQFYLQSLQMIKEGAVVKGEIKGTVHDIRPNKKGTVVFKRCGTALSIPLKKEWSI